MGAGVGEQVRKLELDAYQAFLKVTAVTGMSWVSARCAAPESVLIVPPSVAPSLRRFAVTRPAHAFPPSPRRSETTSRPSSGRSSTSPTMITPASGRNSRTTSASRPSGESARHGTRHPDPRIPSRARDAAKYLGLISAGAEAEPSFPSHVSSQGELETEGDQPGRQEGAHRRRRLHRRQDPKGPRRVQAEGGAQGEDAQGTRRGSHRRQRAHLPPRPEVLAGRGRLVRRHHHRLPPHHQRALPDVRDQHPERDLRVGRHLAV